MPELPDPKSQDIEYPYGDRLYVGEKLKKGQGLISSDHRILLILQADNNLAIHARQHEAIPWETSTTNYAVEHAELTDEGLVLIDDKGETVWTSRGHDCGWVPDDESYAVLQNDGDLVLWRQIEFSGAPVWWSNSAHFRPAARDLPVFEIERFEWPVGGWTAPTELERMNEYTVSFASPEGAITVKGPTSYPDVLSFRLDRSALRLIGDNSILTGEIPNLVFSRESDGLRAEGMLAARFTHDTPLCLNNDDAKSITRNLPDDHKDHMIMLTMQNTKWLFDEFGFFGKVVATYWDGSKQNIELSGSASGAIWTMNNSIKHKRSGEWITL